MKKILVIFCLFLLSSPAYALVDASVLKMRIFAVAVSISEDCSFPVQVFRSDTATEVDFLDNPELGKGNVPEGTYNCIIIRMADTITFQASANDGSCAINTDYKIDICAAGTTTTLYNASSNSFDSSNTSCTGTNSTEGSDVVTVYLTRNSPVASSGGTTLDFQKPLDVNDTERGLYLTSSLVVKDSIVAEMVVDASNRVIGDGPSCQMNAPGFGFSQI